MTEIIIFFALLLVIIPLGIRVLRIFIRSTKITLTEESFVGFGLGSGFLGLLVLFVGMAGLLYRYVLIGLLLLFFLILIKDIKSYLKRVIIGIKGLRLKELVASERLLITLIVFIWLFALAGALTPLLGTDAVSYHMRDAKVFIDQHEVTHIPYTRESMWPFLVQMLFTLGLSLKGPIIGKLFNFTFGIFAITVVYHVCRNYFSRFTSFLAAAIFASIPAIFTSANYAYTDLAVVFYTITAFYSFSKWLSKREPSWLYLSAVLCGFLLGIKVTSATVPAIIAVLYIYDCVRARSMNKKSFFNLLFFMFIVFLVCGVWYIRSWVALGNPIFPFAGYIFGGNGYLEQYLRYQTTSGIGMGIMEYLKLPWLLTLKPDMFGGESVGVVFLIFLPMLIFARCLPKFIKYIIFTALVLYTGWFIIYQYTRFLFPALSFFAILVAYAYSEICRKDRIIFKIATAALILIFLYSAALAVYHNLSNLPVAFGFENRQDYLRKRERSYKMAEYINQNLPKTAKIFVLEDPHLFYIDRDVVDAFCFKMDTRCDKFIKNADEFARYLSSEGFDYVLHLEYRSLDAKGVSFNSPAEILGNHNTQLVKEIGFEYKNEKYVYQLWSIRKR